MFALATMENKDGLAITELPTIGEEQDLINRYSWQPVEGPVRSEEAQCVADYFEKVRTIDKDAILGRKFGERGVAVVSTLHADALENIMYSARYALQATMEAK